MPTHPTQDRRGRKLQAALGDHLHQVTQADLVAQIPTHTQDDYFAAKVSSCKQLFQALQLAHSSDLASPRSALTSLFAPEPHKPVVLIKASDGMRQLPVGLCISTPIAVQALSVLRERPD